MKKLILSFLIVGVFAFLQQGIAALVPPDWTGSNGYTHQNWEFHVLNVDELHCPPRPNDPQPVSPGIPGRDIDYLLADSRFDPPVNRFGEAKLIHALVPDGMFGTLAHYPPYGDYPRCGYYGGMQQEGSALVFEIPSDNQPGKQKEIWIQWLFFTDKKDSSRLVETGRSFRSQDADLPMNRIVITDTDNIIQVDTQITEEDSNEFGVWCQASARYIVTDNPSIIYIKIYGLGDLAALIDEVIINTRSIESINVEVEETLPLDHAMNVKVDSPVEISFDLPMDTDATDDAFTVIESNGQEVQGLITWKNNNKTLTFRPFGFFKCGTSYTINILNTARAVQGSLLSHAYSFSFNTEMYLPPSPLLTGIPSGIVSSPDFDIAVNGSGIYRYRYEIDGMRFNGTFYQDQPISLRGLDNGEHRLVIKAMDALQEWRTIETVEWTIRMPVRVMESSPKELASISTDISMYFNQPMNRRSVESAFSIEPFIEGTFYWNNDQEVIFYPESTFQDDIMYTYRLSISAMDSVGNPLASEFSSSFLTYSGDALVRCPVEYDTFLLFSGMGGGAGYPNGNIPDGTGDTGILKTGGIPICDGRILIKFDLAKLSGIDPRDIIKATFHYYMLDGHPGFRALSSASIAGVPMYGFIRALNTTTFEYTLQDRKGPLPHPEAPVFWNEDLSGQGYVYMKNKPGYVPGSPMIMAVHTTGPKSHGAVDITDLVRGWSGGKYPNNGMELKDHDDRSYIDSQWKDGYNWLISSREGKAGPAPYLTVQINAKDRVKIQEQMPDNSPISAILGINLHAIGGNAENYAWSMESPSGLITFEGEGPEMSFMPNTAEMGLFRVRVTDGEDTDTIFVIMPNPAGQEYEQFIYTPSDEMHARSEELFPVYIGGEMDPADQEGVYNICENVVDDIGETGMLEDIRVETDDLSRTCFGGVNTSAGARTSIAIIDQPFFTNKGVFVINESGKKTCEMNIAEGDISYLRKAYLVATDTAQPSWNNTSMIYNFTIYDEEYNELDSDYLNTLELTISFNKDIIFPTESDPDPIGNSSFMITYVEETADFFRHEEVSEKNYIPVEDIVEVNYEEGWVRFMTAHLSSFGLQEASLYDKTTLPEMEHEDLGSGCFIATAAFGSFMDKDVKVLRDFRDVYLLTNRLGTSFVFCYYRYSPPVADFIASNDALKMLVRWSLMPLVGFSSLMLETTPVQKGALFILLTGILWAIWLFSARRRRLSESYRLKQMLNIS